MMKKFLVIISKDLLHGMEIFMHIGIKKELFIQEQLYTKKKKNIEQHRKILDLYGIKGKIKKDKNKKYWS